MDPETIAQGAGYIALGIAAWPFCKYVVGPVFAGTHATDSINQVSKEILSTYRSNYANAIEQRAKVVIELGRAGKNGQEISDILDSTMPIPEMPEL